MNNLSTSRAWIMWLSVSLFYAYQYVLRVIPNILMPELMENFNTSSTHFGQFAGLYYIGYAAAHIPIGYWLDQYNPKIIIPICILVTILGALPLALSNNLLLANFGRFIMGIGSSGAILGAFKVIRIGFDKTNFNRMLGICVTIGLIGALYGGMPVSYILKTVEWKTVILSICAIGVVLALITYISIPLILSDNKSERPLKGIKKVLTNKNILTVCICCGMMVGPLEGFADVWGAAFLESVYKIDRSIAAGITSLIFVGMCFGASSLTYLADKTQKHVTVILSAGSLMAILFTCMLNKVFSTSMLSIICIIIGICSAYQIIGIYVASSFAQEKLIGTTTAVANMIIMVFGYFFHSVIGALIGPSLGGNILDQQYIRGISIIPICLTIACIFLYLFIGRKKLTK